MRDANCDLVLALLERGGAQTRAELARVTSLTPQALGSILGELVDEGLVVALEPEINGRGRPSSAYCIDADASFWVGASVQWRSVFVAVSDAAGDIRARAQFPHDGSSMESLLSELADQATDLVASVDPTGARLCAAGLSVQGLVDPATGRVVDAVAWPDRDVDARAAFEALTGWPTHLDSAARATARAEVLRSTEPRGLVAVLYFSHDPYLVLVHGGEVLGGRHGTGGELAHLPIPGATSRCTCGRRGCMSTVVSGSALVERYVRESGRPARAVPDVIAAARLGDDVAKVALDEFGRVAAQMTTLLVPYLDPSLLIVSGLVGGPDSRGAVRLVEQIREGLRHEQADLEVVISPLGRDAHAWGALTLARQERGLRSSVPAGVVRALAPG